MLFEWWPLGKGGGGGGVVRCEVLCLGLLHVGQMNAEVFGRKAVETPGTTSPSITSSTTVLWQPQISPSSFMFLLYCSGDGGH